MMYLLVFLAQFFAVAFLVMNSKLLRDDRWVLAMANSWLISVTQFIFVWVVAQAGDDTILPTFLSAASGGSLGCGVAHLTYTRWIMKG